MSVQMPQPKTTILLDNGLAQPRIRVLSEGEQKAEISADEFEWSAIASSASTAEMPSVNNIVLYGQSDATYCAECAEMLNKSEDEMHANGVHGTSPMELHEHRVFVPVVLDETGVSA